MISLTKRKIRGLKITGSCDNREMFKIISSYPEVVFNLSSYSYGDELVAD